MTPKQQYYENAANTILKTYGRQSYLDAIIFLGGGFSALTGYGLSDYGQIQMTDSHLFDQTNKLLEKNHKTAGMIFGVPVPYAQSINSRGLMQVLSNLTYKRK